MSDLTLKPNQESLDLERRIRNFLASRNFPALRRLEISVSDGQAIISGMVSTYHEKQLATSCCQRVAGVLEVINQIEVVRDESGNGKPILRESSH